MAVFGIAPGAFRAVETTGAAGVFIDALHALGPERDHQIPLGAIVNERAQVRIVIGGVADFRPEHVEILMVENADVALAGNHVLDLDLPDHDRAMEIDDIIAIEREF